jgi:hypothetical protein
LVTSTSHIETVQSSEAVNAKTPHGPGATLVRQLSNDEEEAEEEEEEEEEVPCSHAMLM